jgi:hypothetical protein
MEIFRLMPPDAVVRDHIAFSSEVDTGRVKKTRQKQEIRAFSVLI